MNFQVTLSPGNQTYQSDAETSILQAALNAGFVLPYGCRNGACGSCKGKIIAGQVDYGQFQENMLTAEERQAGLALFCCAKPLSDVVIECREVGSTQDTPIRIMPCRIQKMEKLASDVMALYLKLPATERLQFLAGQYIDVLLKDNKRRSFSLANAPHDDELLQLHIRHIPGGKFTDHVFNTMKERDILRFQGPYGAFFLREECDKPILFVAGGTGFAPIKAIIEQAIHSHIKRPMTLYWGARNRAGLYQAKLAETWAATHEHIHFVPVLSHPETEDTWTGRTGFVHAVAMEDYPNLSDYQVYACGAPDMVTAARRDFTQQCGLPTEAFFADSFEFAADGA